jgi:hypothetical protein
VLMLIGSRWFGDKSLCERKREARPVHSSSFHGGIWGQEGHGSGRSADC